MSKNEVVSAPLAGTVLALELEQGSTVMQGESVLVLESMKVHVPVVSPIAGSLQEIWVEAGQTIEAGAPLFAIAGEIGITNDKQKVSESVTADTESNTEKLQQEFKQRAAQSLDPARAAAADKRHQKGYRTARENLAGLVEEDSFIEYGQFAVAAQRGRRTLEELQTETAADGIITGVGRINSDLFVNFDSRAAVVINDYSVLAGTQGFFHHQKLDRIIALAGEQGLPVIMYTEGGGGRPGDTDVTTVNTGLNCTSFERWASLSGVVPRVAVANGYNFAGNAALYGAADITIATRNSWIGMAGPAMVEGGGLGKFKPTEIGPIEIQQANSVVDIVADDEASATETAKRCLAVFQSARSQQPLSVWSAVEQGSLRQAMPDNRRFTYPVREIIETIVDQSSFIEMKRFFGGAIAVGFATVEGRAVGVLASDCMVLGGAIDVDAGEKAADFMQLCNDFKIPMVSLSDTPGFMVGPEHEKLGAVRRLAKMFTAGSKISVPTVSVILRKCYGLGAQALLGGSSVSANYSVAWPTGEFGAMGLEGAVKLGFKRELDAIEDTDERALLFQKLLAEQYRRGQASEIASMLEVDAVIDPIDTRQTIVNTLFR